MGIEAEFKQVSPYLLEKLKEYPDWTELFFDAKYLPDSPFWQSRGWTEESFGNLRDYTYNPLVRYYQDAAEKKNAMFLYLA